MENKMERVDIKPMSINEMYYGKLHETKEAKQYKRDVSFLLPNNFKVPEPPFEIHFKFGFSSQASDWDNCVKKIQDLLAKKYGFNDKLIKKAVVEVEHCAKGKEYFEFDILHLKQ